MGRFSRLHRPASRTPHTRTVMLTCYRIARYPKRLADDLSLVFSLPVGAYKRDGNARFGGGEQMRQMIVIVLSIFIVTLGCSKNPIKRDPVTSGFAKKYIVKGETTQQEIIEIFGAPNIVTRATGRSENWTYDRVSFQSSGKSGGLVVLGGAIIGSGLAGGSAGYGGYSETSASRTVTLVIYFDDNEIVSDYSIIETHF